MRRAGQVGLPDPRRRCARPPSPASRPASSTSSPDASSTRPARSGCRKNYPTYKPGEGFPADTCISVNEEVVHGIPGERHAQGRRRRHARPGAVAQRLLRRHRHHRRRRHDHPRDAEAAGRDARDARHWRSSNIKPGQQVVRHRPADAVQRGAATASAWSASSSATASAAACTKTRRSPNFVTAEQLRGDFKLRPGMTLAVEPMVVMGRRDVDCWKTSGRSSPRTASPRPISSTRSR